MIVRSGDRLMLAAPAPPAPLLPLLLPCRLCARPAAAPDAPEEALTAPAAAAPQAATPHLLPLESLALLLHGRCMGVGGSQAWAPVAVAVREGGHAPAAGRGRPSHASVLCTRRQAGCSMLRSSADADCSHPRVELKAISSTSTNQHIQAVPLPYFNCLEVECVAWLSSHTFPRPDEQKLQGGRNGGYRVNCCKVKRQRHTWPVKRCRPASCH